MLNIETFTDMSFGTNSYVIWEEGASKAVLIDAGMAVGSILEFLESRGLTLEAVLLTHGHPDHIVGAAEIAGETGAPVYLHEIDSKMVEMMPPTLLAMLGIDKLDVPDEFKPLQDGQVLELAGLEIEVLHTPGHSPGSVSFLVDGALFDGDLVFRASIGRTDFPGGDFELLLRSVKDKVFVLDPGTKLYPGHMGPTSVAWEKRANPFLTGI
ncbi:MAG: MBL fold metallo-hydrolase [Actinobacteria bacterium]|nr:MBL fold metallo-hydrolase [Actinomycetota bacterium]MBU4489153.1 MBL fold metallo-hydrolase [Actinomycetota bacterium]MCG2795264.1 MBL fold metallo-hydrolase [Actinomycetes bacterium]